MELPTNPCPTRKPPSAVQQVTQRNPRRITFSEKFACPVSGFTIDEIEPRLFSFNNPFGACPKCDGLGTELRFEADLVVPDKSLSMRQGCIVPWAKTGATSPYYTQTLQALCKHYKASMSTPWEELDDDIRTQSAGHRR